jgi:hypothetical protein
MNKVMNKKKCLLVSLICLASLLPASISNAESHWKRGMWIGATSGAVALGLPLGIATATNACDSGDSDLQICGESWGVAMGLGGAAAGALVGLGIGALIGSAIKKEPSYTLAPTVFANRDGLAGGILFQKRF